MEQSRQIISEHRLFQDKRRENSDVRVFFRAGGQFSKFGKIEAEPMIKIDRFREQAQNFVDAKLFKT